MPEPLVSTLVYRTLMSVEADYSQAPPLEAETERVVLRLTCEQVVVRLKSGPLPESDARRVADETLRAWEVSIGLLHAPSHMSFRFDRAVLEGPTVPPSANGGPEETLLLSDEVVPPTVHDRFPEPPHRFRLSPEADMMYQRYRLYRDGRESLTGTADWCLTVLETSARGRAEAADRYRIDPKVLRKLRELCGQRGVIDGRHPRNGVPPLKPGEREWMRALIRRMILRAGEVAFDPVAKLPILGMADLPPLP
jgi:hypothetical protein